MNCPRPQNMYDFMYKLLMDKTLGPRFYVVKRILGGFVIAVLAPNQKNYLEDFEELNFRWELFLRYYDSKLKRRPKGTKEYTKMRSAFSNSIVKCKCPGQFSKIKKLDIAKWGIHPIKEYLYFLYQCNDVRLLPNWPVGADLETVNCNDINDETYSVEEIPNPKSLNNCNNELVPVDAGCQDEFPKPSGDQTFIFSVKFNPECVAEYKLLAVVADEEMSRSASRSKILTIAMESLMQEDSVQTEEPMMVVEDHSSFSMPSLLNNINGPTNEVNSTVVVPADQLILAETGKNHLELVSNVSQDPPMELPTPQFLLHDYYVAAEANDDKLKSVRMATQDNSTVVIPADQFFLAETGKNHLELVSNVSQDPPMELSTPQFILNTPEQQVAPIVNVNFSAANKVLNTNEEGNIPDEQMEHPHDLKSRRWSRETDDGYDSSFEEEPNFCLDGIPLESCLNNDDFDIDSFFNPLCDSKQSENVDGSPQIDIEACSELINPEFWKMEECFIPINRGTSNH